MEEKQQNQEAQEAEVKEQSNEARFTQNDLDKIVQERIARERNKYSDYEELRQKVSEYNQLKSMQEEKDLESKQQYEKLKESWAKEKEIFQQKLNEKEQAITYERIGNSLTNEILNQNAYPDAIDLLRSKAVFEDGEVKIKGHDSNGIETLLSVQDGVKSFLENKPYLIKSTAPKGSGTSPAISDGTQGNQNNLIAELELAQQTGNRKRVAEVKALIRQKHATQGVNTIF